LPAVGVWGGCGARWDGGDAGGAGVGSGALEVSGGLEGNWEWSWAREGWEWAGIGQRATRVVEGSEST